MTTRTQIPVALLCAALAGGAAAQTYPAKPIRFVLPYPPGGGSDTIARPLAQKLSESMGQQVVVDNRGGAGGSVGMEVAARAAPDGYTIAMGLTAQLAVNPALFKKLPYDPVRDFAPVTLLGSGIYILVVHPSLPVKSVKELIALAKKRPGQIAYASSGNGSGAHLAGELLKMKTGINLTHVPYKGGGPALVALLSGEVQMTFATQLASAQHIKSGRVRALAITTARRSRTLPDLPTVAQAGVPGYDTGVWYAIVAPAGTPHAIVARLNTEILHALKQPDYRGLLERNGIEPLGSTPEELERFIKEELGKYAKVVKDAHIHVD